jgi:hypothetical protein
VEAVLGDRGSRIGHARRSVLSVEEGSRVPPNPERPEVDGGEREATAPCPAV